MSTSATLRPRPVAPPIQKPKLWLPKRVLFTADALEQPFGQQMLARMKALRLNITELSGNRLPSLTGKDERETYRLAKQTLAVVNAPPSMMKLQPIPPSADWQFHLAKGCPAHCQYCYLAGSLSGPPITRVYANLPDILAALAAYEQPGRLTTFEASCYTDPLSLEHLTGSLSECVRYFGTREAAQLRWVSKFDAVEPLLDVPHSGRTRARVSVNAEMISQRLEGGTAPVAARLAGLRKLAQAGYPVGVVVAPIMPIEGWKDLYSALFERLETALDLPCDLTFELISHRFTPGSKEVLEGWYPNSSLEMNEEQRAVKRNKFGGLKYVYTKDIMNELRTFFETEIAMRFPKARLLYWT
ncbi:MAG: Spore photoproduct lyase [uncultured Truepera sp.]|uniref:Spore photoproduct lyase n=1 Tax=uncultured Truepera sp. TaxID=543023 RepID=A0A6J4VRX3_9DEIN|nr:MAG: Spore photoproduct lyase [uncultured Truepera sp.]